MIRLAIVVEGETEERFVEDVLAGHLHQFRVIPSPVLLGGRISADRLGTVMANLHWNFDSVTSLVDFYGFRGKGTDTVDQLEQRILNRIDDKIRRPPDNSLMLPYVQLHEFESLLFSDVSAFRAIPGSTNGLVERLRTIRSNFRTPEDINDNYATAPSRRIQQLLPRYRKAVHGPDLIAAIGLGTIRGQCRRFSRWLRRLESLASRPA